VLASQAQADLGVQRGERLVEEEDRRTARQRPRERHPLLLPAGELVREATLEPVQADELDHLRHALPDLRLPPAGDPQPEGDVVGHRHRGEQGIGLEDDPDAPLARRDRVDHAAVEQHLPAIRTLESGDQAERGGLPAPRPADHGDELTVRDVER
jgi:hypothetical protein